MIDTLSSQRPLRAVLVVIFAVVFLTLSDILVKTRSLLSQRLTSRYATLSSDRVDRARRSLSAWLKHLSESTGGVRTERIGCRELPDGAQSCVFEGVMCIETSSGEQFHKPGVYFLDNTRPDGMEVVSDDWCGLRHRSSDPRYWHGRHWPILKDTVAPRWSCLQAVYRSAASLGPRLRGPGVKWIPSLWLLDFDFIGQAGSHNNHFFMDIIWMLDAVLWQKSLDFRHRPGVDNSNFGDSPGHLFAEGPTNIYLPEGIADFEAQTSPDINRLMFSLILQLNISRLYDNPTAGKSWTSKPLLKAYPELQNRLLFHRNFWQSPNTSMVCTSRLTSGAKLSTGGHERVCRHIRERVWKLFGIPALTTREVGQAYYAVPPPRIVIVQRHISRKIFNLGELEGALKQAFPWSRGFAVETATTEELSSAEAWARIYSRAGVLITPHGSHNMGELFMPRHRLVSLVHSTLRFRFVQVD